MPANGRWDLIRRLKVKADTGNIHITQNMYYIIYLRISVDPLMVHSCGLPRDAVSI